MNRHLNAEADGATGAATAEYVWLEGMPLAFITGGAVYFVHADHLGTPQRLTDGAKAVVWDAAYAPFGSATVSGSVNFNLRFPGQYEDAETGLHYNYFRDYDPELGRYVESDPIGLRGGWNTYGYVGGKPVAWFDFFGLKPAGSGGCTVTWVGSGSIRNVYAVHRVVESVATEWQSELIGWEYSAPAPWDEVPRSGLGWAAYIISLTNPKFNNCLYKITSGIYWEEADVLRWTDYVITCRSCKGSSSTEKRAVFGPFDDSTAPTPFRDESLIRCVESWINYEEIFGAIGNALE